MTEFLMRHFLLSSSIRLFVDKTMEGDLDPRLPNQIFN